MTDPFSTRNGHSVLCRMPRRADRPWAEAGERGIVRKIFIAIMLGGAILASGCNTVEGAGKDVASVGDAVAKAAK